MSRIEWDKIEDKQYETGCDRGVLYVMSETGKYPTAEAWNGLQKVNDAPEGAEETKLWAGNQKYLSLFSTEEYKGTIEAYMYPKGFMKCDGTEEVIPGLAVTGQTRATFGLAYRTLIGNEPKGNDYGYKIHIVYGAKAQPSQQEHNTINDSPEALTLSYEFTTTPVKVPGMKPSAKFVADSTVLSTAQMTLLENTLYGAEGVEGRLPSPEELIEILTEGN